HWPSLATTSMPVFTSIVAPNDADGSASITTAPTNPPRPINVARATRLTQVIPDRRAAAANTHSLPKSRRQIFDDRSIHVVYHDCTREAQSGTAAATPR